jgi:heterodisulfide reductase subunit C2
MTVRIKKQSGEKGLLPVVGKMSGVDLSLCYQCKKCSSGCPVAGITRSTPSEIVRRLQLGAGNELLDSDLIWLCLSCETCYARCPMKIDIAAVMDTLRNLALAEKASLPRGNAPLFNRTFLSMVKRFGRAYDLSAIMLYKLGGGNFSQDIEKFPGMVRKGKIALLPPSGANKQVVKRIFTKTQRKREAEK